MRSILEPVSPVVPMDTSSSATSSNFACICCGGSILTCCCTLRERQQMELQLMQQQGRGEGGGGGDSSRSGSYCLPTASSSSLNCNSNHEQHHHHHQRTRSSSSSSSSSSTAATTGTMAIEINNYAVSELSKGHYKTAYEALSYALDMSTCCQQAADNNNKNHQHQHQHQHARSNRHQQYPHDSCCNNDDDDVEECGSSCHKKSYPSHYPNRRMMCPYQYAWVDCTATVQKALREDSKLNQSQYAPFLFTKLLLILPLQACMPKIGSKEGAAPCCYEWVLSYNLGVVTAMMGRNIDSTGRTLLQKSLELFHVVQQRVTLELDHQQKQQQQQQQQHTNNNNNVLKHWSTLQLGIWNNLACIYSEASVGFVRDQSRLEKLVQMGLFLSSNHTSTLLDVRDCDRFHWTLQVLMDDNFAAAA